MLQIGPRRRTYATWTAALLLTSALGACNKGEPGPSPSDSGSDALTAPPAALPLSTTTPAQQASAPPVTALPGGSTVPLAPQAARGDAYGYLDRAYYQEDAVEDAPPDYTFDDGGVRPWTWTSGDGARVISEPVAGGYRTYYYDDGSDTPYLVRDPQYAYAYDNGALVSVFTLAGVPVDLAPGSPPLQYAGRYLVRGHALWQGSNSDPHQAVNAYAWSDRRADLSAQRVAWQRNISRNGAWSAWNSAHQDEEQSKWSDVRAQHQQAAQQFSSWQQQHFQGPPPHLYGAPAGPEHQDHTAAIVGGAVAAGVVAGAVHAVAGPHQPPHPTMGPAAEPHMAQPHEAGAAAHEGRAAPAAAPARLAQPEHAAPRAEPHPAPARLAQPEHAAPRAEPHPAHLAPPEHAAPRAEPHAAPAPQRAEPPRQAPGPHEAPRPAPKEHEHGEH